MSLSHMELRPQAEIPNTVNEGSIVKPCRHLHTLTRVGCSLMDLSLRIGEPRGSTWPAPGGRKGVDITTERPLV